jgi:hypothetical protein
LLSWLPACCTHPASQPGDPGPGSATSRYAVLGSAELAAGELAFVGGQSLGGCVETRVGIAVLGQERAPGTLVGKAVDRQGSDRGRSAMRTARCRGSHRNSRTAAPNRPQLRTSARTRGGTFPVPRTPRLGPSPRHCAGFLRGEVAVLGIGAGLGLPWRSLSKSTRVPSATVRYRWLRRPAGRQRAARWAGRSRCSGVSPWPPASRWWR